jgi:4-hydroxybenzoate polyprenyltransferase
MIGSEQLRVSSEASALDAAAATSAAATRTSTGSPFPLIAWAMAASTYHRMWLGEGVLLAINVSILFYRAVGLADLIAGTIVSVLALGVMYAYNDVYDAESDRQNPKKDQRQVSVYIDYRQTCYRAIFGASVATIALAWVLIGPASATATAIVLAVNYVYSRALKGVPFVDVAWCGIWGAAFAAVVLPPADLMIMVGLMTAVCHLYQALGDRLADAQNRITTTAVFSSTGSATVLFVLSAMIGMLLRGPLGDLVALSAMIPFALFFLLRNTHLAWILTKLYYGLVWLAVLGQGNALV